MTKIDEASLKKLYDINFHADDFSDGAGTDEKLRIAEIVLCNIREFFRSNQISLPNIYDDLIEDLERRSKGDEPFFFKKRPEETYYEKHFVKYHASLAVEYLMLRT